MKKRGKGLMLLAAVLSLCLVTISGCGQIAEDAANHVLKETNTGTDISSGTEEEAGVSKEVDQETEEENSVSEEVDQETEAEAAEEDAEVWAACTPVNSVPKEDYASDEERQEARWEAGGSEEFGAFKDAMGGFTGKTASELLKKESGNSCYSPASLYLALAAATGGAEEETREQLLTLLGFSEEEELAQACNKACLALCQDAESGQDAGSGQDAKSDQDAESDNEERGSYLLQIASSIWMSQDHAFKEEYKEHVAKEYSAELFQADFNNPQLAGSMAKWVKEHTGGRIEPQIEVSRDQILFLLNTVHYQDEWVNRFDEAQTKPDVFHCGDGTEITCDFMNQPHSMGRFFRGDNFTESVLSGKNSQLTILLPDEGVDVHTFLASPEALEASLLLDTWAGEGQDGWQPGMVTWQIPKFSFGGKYDLVEMLNRLGVTDAFSPEKADFGAMTEEAAFFNQVKQETHIGIDENGIEAAAFTEIGMAGAGMATGEAEMILNRPFLYMVSVQDVPLFVGVCENPAEE